MPIDDLYAAGMRRSPNYLRKKEEVGYGSAKDAAVEAGLLKSQIKQLNAAMVEYTNANPDKPLPDNFVKGFYSFVEQFDKWTKTESERNRLAQWLSDDSWRAVQMYKEQFAGYAKEFERLSDIKIEPPPRPSVKTPTNPKGKDSGGGMWKYILGAVALFGAGYAGYKLAEEGVSSYKRKLGIR